MEIVGMGTTTKIDGLNMTFGNSMKLLGVVALVITWTLSTVAAYNRLFNDIAIMKTEQTLKHQELDESIKAIRQDIGESKKVNGELRDAVTKATTILERLDRKMAP